MKIEIIEETVDEETGEETVTVIMKGKPSLTFMGCDEKKKFKIIKKMIVEKWKESSLYRDRRIEHRPTHLDMDMNDIRELEKNAKVEIQIMP